MNRDERRTRAPGTPPRHHEIESVPVLAPLDGEAGGSWLTVNDRGLTLALLNRYDDTPHDSGAGYISRGKLVLRLAPLRSPQDVLAVLAGTDLTAFRPFTLASLGPEPSASLFEWHGSARTIASVASRGLLATSSGADQQGAARQRGEAFRVAAARPGGLTPELLRELHRSHAPERGPLSICMHREDAVTVSSALITVLPEEVSFHQVEGSPCEPGPLTELRMPRAADSSR